MLLRRLADARKAESVVVVTRVCRDISAVDGVDKETQARLNAALVDANRWLEGQAQVRHNLFSRLDKAVTGQHANQIRKLLAHVNATASHDRTEAENDIANAAASYFAAFARQRQAEAAARRAAPYGSRASAQRVSKILNNLRHHNRQLPTTETRALVEVLAQAAAEAGDRVTAD
ncbi:hypothetical protein [Streptomyces sirii]|uniref:hypothetical protein n=1 Tax=Streptomyces sirii TaxID=3127701 RepID=UPI003D35A4B7